MKYTMLIAMIMAMAPLAGCLSSGNDVTIVGYSEKCALNEGAAYLYINGDRDARFRIQNAQQTISFSFEITGSFEDGEHEVKFVKGDQTVVCSGEITGKTLK